VGTIVNKVSKGRYCENGVWYAEFSDIILEPTNRYNGDRRMYRLRQEFTFDLTYKGGWESITIPEGYETDLATLPRVLTFFLGRRDDYLEESIIHDWLCDHGQPRFFTNAKMRQVMYVIGRPRWKRWCIFYGLMAFGYGSLVMSFFSRSSK
jgi:hypothetical protein